jgi:hypothetical protein
MHRLIGCTTTGTVTVDPVTACVSYERNRRCVIFSLCSQHPIKFVKSRGLPPSFIEVQRAQQVLLLLHSQPSTSAPNASPSPAQQHCHHHLSRILSPAPAISSSSAPFCTAAGTNCHMQPAPLPQPLPPACACSLPLHTRPPLKSFRAHNCSGCCA